MSGEGKELQELSACVIRLGERVELGFKSTHSKVDSLCDEIVKVRDAQIEHGKQIAVIHNTCQMRGVRLDTLERRIEDTGPVKLLEAEREKDLERVKDNRKLLMWGVGILLAIATSVAVPLIIAFWPKK